MTEQSYNEWMQDRTSAFARYAGRTQAAVEMFRKGTIDANGMAEIIENALAELDTALDRKRNELG